jgi:DNA-binding NarL/FixJ family response regulator
VTSKELLYGEVFELNKTALAMDGHEAAQVLVGRSAPSASGLVSVANGWPALIGLAGESHAEIEDAGPEEHVPESLYRFFAEEVFSSFTVEVQQGMSTLAVAPILDRELAAILLGPEAGEEVCTAALEVGIIVERGVRLDLHPLARAFLIERRGELGLGPPDAAAASCLDYYRSRRDWDAAFEVLLQGGPTGELDDLMRPALDELLETARLSTVQRWCDLAAASELTTPIFAIARAEVMLRHGKHVEAMAHAEGAAHRDRELAFRALSLAGRAAQLASREEEALDFYRRAEAEAATDSERRDAVCGQLMCVIDLELPGAAEALEDVIRTVTYADPRDAVRAAALRVYLQLRSGSLDLRDADLAFQLLPTVTDPFVVSSFLSGYGIALSLCARYQDAIAISDELAAVADRYRLSFAIPYALCAAANGHAGQRRWRLAESLANDAFQQASEKRDIHAQLLSASILVRVLLQQGRLGPAIEFPMPDASGAVNASRAEADCTQALVLACAGRASAALELVEASRDCQAVEPVVLVRAVEAVVALRSRSANVLDPVDALAEVAFSTGAVDLLVSTYRACPEALAVLLRNDCGDKMRRLVVRVGDADLADAAGHPVAVGHDRRALLSTREREVFELLRSGLANKEIAKLLFIEESTVKRHAQNIYNKLGIRSRVALRIQAALERADQATSATSGTTDVDSAAS